MQTVPFDKREGHIWYNGEIIPWQDAKVHVLNHGLHYASSVFEGERIYNNKIFKSRIHTERLFKSAEILDFTLPYSVDELEQAKLDIIKKQDIEFGYMRAFAWRGSEQMAISAKKTSAHVAIAAWSSTPYYSKELHEKGINLDWAIYRRPDPATAPVAAKAAGLYMICTISKHKAEQDGFNDALMLDYEGYVAEATGANFFMVVDGELHTPLADRFLNGITRQTVIKLAKDMGITVHERRIKPEELATAQEAFLTGSAAEITPVGQVAEHGFVPADVTKKLKDAYHALVRS